MHHKRHRPKARRAGCLLCKPHKLTGEPTDAARRVLQEPVEAVVAAFALPWTDRPGWGLDDYALDDFHDQREMDAQWCIVCAGYCGDPNEPSVHLRSA